MTVTNEINKQVEHLRLDVNDRAGAPQLLSRHIDLEFGKAKIQGGPSFFVSFVSLLRDGFVK
jgi:hypothetical protein